MFQNEISHVLRISYKLVQIRRGKEDFQCYSGKLQCQGDRQENVFSILETQLCIFGCS